jgi:hypothetical protein
VLRRGPIRPLKEALERVPAGGELFHFEFCRDTGKPSFVRPLAVVPRLPPGTGCHAILSGCDDATRLDLIVPTKWECTLSVGGGGIFSWLGGQLGSYMNPPRFGCFP